jgi:flagellar hook-associated protein FlgK
MMNRIVWLGVVVVFGIVGLGFYRGWFVAGSNKVDGKTNVTLSMDTEKFQEDKNTAVAKVVDIEHQISDKVGGPSEKAHDGTVVAVGADKLTMTDKDGKEHSHKLAANVKVTCDGKDSTAANLKAGMKIRVTTDSADAATKIEAIDKDVAFAANSHDGKTVSITAAKLVMTNMEGAAEQTYTLTADSKITCDGIVCKAADVKPGMRIRVTTENAESHAAIRIEAIEQNRDFEKGA